MELLLKMKNCWKWNVKDWTGYEKRWPTHCYKIIQLLQLTTSTESPGLQKVVFTVFTLKDEFYG